VELATTTTPNQGDRHTLISILRRILKKSANGHRYPTGESLESAISLVLTAALRSANYRHLPQDQQLADFQHFCVFTLGLQLNTAPPTIQGNAGLCEGNGNRYYNALSRVSNNRRIFETSHHYFGIGPQSLRTGDLVCVIVGAMTPVVLRPLPGSGGLHQLLGDCYLHGIMFGEAIPPKWAVSEPEVFRIR
jgi:hypothetical protein